MSPYNCLVHSLQVLQFPPAVQTHADEVSCSNLPIRVSVSVNGSSSLCKPCNRLATCPGCDPTSHLKLTGIGSSFSSDCVLCWMHLVSTLLGTPIHSCSYLISLSCGSYRLRTPGRRLKFPRWGEGNYVLTIEQVRVGGRDNTSAGKKKFYVVIGTHTLWSKQRNLFSGFITQPVS